MYLLIIFLIELFCCQQISCINLVTLYFRRVIFVTKGQIFGQWDCEWRYTWAELKEVPTATNKGVQILLKVYKIQLGLWDFIVLEIYKF